MTQGALRRVGCAQGMVGSASQLGVSCYEFGDRHSWYANLFADHDMTERTFTGLERVVESRAADAKELRGFAHGEEK